LLGIAAVVLAGLGQHSLPAGAVFDLALCFGVAVLLFLAAFWSARFDPLLAPPAFGAGVWAIDGWSARVATGLLAMALLLTLNAAQQFHALEPFAAAAWWWHLAAIGSALGGAFLLDSRRGLRKAGEPPAHPDLSTPQTLAWLAIILGGAAFFRFFRLDSLPFGTWYDEAEFGLQALRILGDANFRPIFDGATNSAAHYLYLVAVAFEWVGVETQSIRLVSVGMGVLAVVAAYLAGDELFGRRMGLVAAFLIAVSSWAVTLSRFGLFATMSTPLFALLSVAFALRSLRTQRMADYALTGLWLGLGLCFYTSFRLFVPMIGLFFVYWAVYERLRVRTWPPMTFGVGLAIMSMVAAIITAPLVVFAFKHPELYWSRIEATFILASKGVSDPWLALWENARRHLLMFNVIGDPNGRHNLPGNPMLDSVSAALLVLGGAYTLRRVLQPRYLLLMIWLCFGLLPGILSLDFEAPQSLRANGALPVVYLLVTVALAVLYRAWALGGGRYAPRFVWWPIGALLALSAGLNFHTYFVRQANDFAVWNAYSTPETLAARLLAEVDETTDAYVTSFFHGHPTLRFLAHSARPYAELDTLDQFPLSFVPGRSALLILNAESRALYDEAKHLYPNATFAEMMPPLDGPPVLFTVHLTPEDIASIQGVEARYYAGNAWEGTPLLTRREPAIDADWTQNAPVAKPFSVEWEGILNVARAGVHDFLLEAPGAAEVRIGERPVISGTGVLSGSLALAQGNHTLRVRAAGAPGRIALAWRTPDRSMARIPATALYAVPALGRGLLGRYFANADWRPPEVMSRIDARFHRYIHVTPLPRPYTVEWTGKLVAPVDGLYHFGLESIDESQLWIAGVPVVQANTPNSYQEGQIELVRGLHDIRIHFADRTDHTRINVYWQPPGSSRQILPADVLYPPQGSYDRVSIPILDVASGALGAAGNTLSSLVPELSGVASVVADHLARPTGVAAAPGGILYVAESAAGRVTAFSSSGDIVLTLDDLMEPTDVAVSAERLYVLDAGAGRVRAFDLQGVPQPFAGDLDTAYADRSRGIDVTPEGNVIIANTPNHRAVLLDGAGAVTGQVVVWPGEDAQPVDVVRGPDGSLFVVESQGHRLIRYAGDGQRERSWPISAANTVDSPHLAVDAAGYLYLTEPEQGRVIKLDPTGAPAGAWELDVLLGRTVRPVGIAVAPDGVIWVADSSGGALIALRTWEDGRP